MTEILLLSRADVERLLTPDICIAAAIAVYRRAVIEQAGSTFNL